MRSHAARLGVLAAALLLTACPADDDEPTPSPAATASPTGGVAEGPCEELGIGEQIGQRVLFVTAPGVGEAVTSPVTVEGCANAFEGTVNWELVASDGSSLADGFATASCGNGCLGSFSFDVAYAADAETFATLRVFTISARDGAEEDINSIPVRLQP